MRRESDRLEIVILGLSITSSWGNGHATTYRRLVRELTALGHDVLFLERNTPWYSTNRDMPDPPYGRTRLYSSVEELKLVYEHEIRDADAVIVGSYVPEGIAIGEWVMSTARGVRAFYDIDTPVTLASLEQGDCEYLSKSLVRRYDLYLSFTGGPTLESLENSYGSPMARALYCSFDPKLYYPVDLEPCWDIGYLGTYSDDRQPPLDSLMLDPARRWREGRFIVAGPQYPRSIEWPMNVDRIEHLSPLEHVSFYNGQRFTLNITRDDMVRAGYSPSVRLFEAAACGTPIISDWWDGLDTILTPDREVLISQSSDDTLAYMLELPDHSRRDIGLAARNRVLAEHTSAHRARELEGYIAEVMGCTAVGVVEPNTGERSEVV